MLRLVGAQKALFAWPVFAPSAYGGAFLFTRAGGHALREDRRE
jgi:hypothetical protein